MEELEPAWTGEPCKNCGALLTGPFCSSCGQKRTHVELSLREWSADGLAALSNLDWRIARTVIGLTRAPGTTVRRWIEGQRIRFTGPFRYAFLTAALWFLGHALVTDSDEVRAQLGETTAFLMQHGQVVNLLAVPVIALGVHLAFLGTRTSYLTHLCLCLFLFGHLFLFRALLVVVANLISLPGSVSNTLDQVFLLVYVPWGLFTFHRDVKRPIVRGLRTFAAFVAVILFSTVLIAAVKQGLEAWLSEPAPGENQETVSESE